MALRGLWIFKIPNETKSTHLLEQNISSISHICDNVLLLGISNDFMKFDYILDKILARIINPIKDCLPRRLISLSNGSSFSDLKKLN
jgi:hypothetical protein